MESDTQITLIEKLSLASLLARAATLTIIRLVTAPFRDSLRANKPLKDAAFAGLRYFSSNLSDRQERYINKNATTVNVYLAYAKQKSFQPEIIELETGLKLCWIGKKDAEKVLLYFHGGGYVAGAASGHFQWAADLQKACSKHNSFSVVLAAYTLTTPTSGRYPIQLREAAEALHWLTETQNKKPGDIMVGGDSAGGHLCISLLSHLLHPHPEAIKIDLVEPLQSAILMSPWVNFRSDDSSYTTNLESDFLSPSTLQKWSSWYRYGSPPDSYNEPIRADAKWFSGLDSVVKDLLIWCGGAEIFVDQIKTFAKTVESVHPKTRLVVQNGASHVDPVVDIIFGYGRHESESLLQGWVSDRI